MTATYVVFYVLNRRKGEGEREWSWTLKLAWIQL